MTTQQIVRHSIVTTRHPATHGVEDRAVTGSTSHHVPHSHLLVIDDSALYRECLLGVLTARQSFSAHGMTWDPTSLIAAMQTTRPDVILLGGSICHSAVLIKQIRQINPAVRVIVTGLPEEDESIIVACAQAGAAGFHLRSESLTDLLALIHAVADGRQYCSPTISGILLRHMSEAAAQRRRPAPKGSVLTAREMQILHMLESGLANRDIADRLCIAVHTVKNHVHSVLTKLGVSSREQAAALARKMIATGELSAI